MQFISKSKTLLASLALMAVAGTAQADALQIKAYQSNSTSYSDFVVGTPVYSGIAALWNVTNTDTSTSFLAYCLELLESVDQTGTHAYVSGAYAPTADVQELYDRYFGTVVQGRVQAVGFQLALWALTGQADVSVFAAPTDVVAQANLLVDGVLNGTTPYVQDRYTYKRWSNNGLQDVLQVTEASNQVPEPHTGALLLGGLGLLAMGMVSRRRKEGRRG